MSTERHSRPYSRLSNLASTEYLYLRIIFSLINWRQSALNKILISFLKYWYSKSIRSDFYALNYLCYLHINIVHDYLIAAIWFPVYSSQSNNICHFMFNKLIRKVTLYWTVVSLFSSQQAHVKLSVRKWDENVLTHDYLIYRQHRERKGIVDSKSRVARIFLSPRWTDITVVTDADTLNNTKQKCSIITV